MSNQENFGKNDPIDYSNLDQDVSSTYFVNAKTGDGVAKSYIDSAKIRGN